MPKKHKEPVESQENVDTPETPEITGTAEPEGGELQALNDRYLRLNAEYVNYRNRTAREKEALWETVKLETLLQFLPVIDNLERALEAETEESSLRKGTEMILRQFLEIMDKAGAKPIDALSQPFDPKVMDAVMHVEDAELGESVVKQVFTKGYMLGERVMRHAVVVVAN